LGEKEKGGADLARRELAVPLRIEKGGERPPRLARECDAS